MDPYLAQVMMFGGNFAPQNWAYCDGSLQSIANNSALFSLLGTTYGGDGQVTFALPDFRGRIGVGTGQGAGLSYIDLGEMAGTQSNSLLQSNLPPHTHSVKIPTTDGSGTTEDPNGNILALGNATAFTSPSFGSGSYGGVTTSITGGGQPFDIMPPYLGLNFIICVEGIYPSRN
jgi:microcystin-dependent protein